jgi:hypothetical protein
MRSATAIVIVSDGAAANRRRRPARCAAVSMRTSACGTVLGGCGRGGHRSHMARWAREAVSSNWGIADRLDVQMKDNPSALAPLPPHCDSAGTEPLPARTATLYPSRRDSPVGDQAHTKAPEIACTQTYCRCPGSSRCGPRLSLFSRVPACATDLGRAGRPGDRGDRRPAALSDL